MAKFKHGSMDTSAQTNTFDGFIGWMSKSIVVILVFLVFLAIVGG